MNDKQKQDFKQYAREEIERLKEEIPYLKERLKPVEPDVSIGRLSRMDNIQNQSVVKTQLSRAQVRMVRLEEALKRVDEDEDFGLCVDCGDPIPMARLKAMPETELCVDCAE